MRVVAKLGTSSLTDEHGVIDRIGIAKAAEEVFRARGEGHEVILVSSGAVAAGLPALGIPAGERPRDARTLQAISAIGQARLMQTWGEHLGGLGMVSGQVLLAPFDFMVRSQYLHARSTIERLLELGVVPIINENDALADDEIRFGDNDRIAALVAQLLGADLLVLLTDAPGLMDADPRFVTEASLIEEIIEIDHELESLAGGSGSVRGSGGMASKLAAAKMASWSGVRAVIAAAGRERVLLDAIDGSPGVGTIVRPRERRLSARKLWIAFALPPSGRITVDDGRGPCPLSRGRSLLSAGVTAVDGRFRANDAVEIVDQSGHVVAKGLTRVDASELTAMAGRRSSELNDGAGQVVHADDLVMLPG